MYAVCTHKSTSRNIKDAKRKSPTKWNGKLSLSLTRTHCKYNIYHSDVINRFRKKPISILFFSSSSSPPSSSCVLRLMSMPLSFGSRVKSRRMESCVLVRVRSCSGARPLRILLIKMTLNDSI